MTEKSNCSSRENHYQGPKSLPKASIELLQCKSFGNYSCSFESYRSFAPRAGLTGHSLGSCTTTESIAARRSAKGARVLEKCPLMKPCSISLGISGDSISKRPLSASEIELSEDYTV